MWPFYPPVLCIFVTFALLSSYVGYDRLSSWPQKSTVLPAFWLTDQNRTWKCRSWWSTFVSWWCLHAVVLWFDLRKARRSTQTHRRVFVRVQYCMAFSARPGSVALWGRFDGVADGTGKKTPYTSHALFYVTTRCSRHDRWVKDGEIITLIIRSDLLFAADQLTLCCSHCSR